MALMGVNGEGCRVAILTLHNLGRYPVSQVDLAVRKVVLLWVREIREDVTLEDEPVPRKLDS